MGCEGMVSVDEVHPLGQRVELGIMRALSSPELRHDLSRWKLPDSPRSQTEALSPTSRRNASPAADACTQPTLGGSISAPGHLIRLAARTREEGKDIVMCD